MKITVFNGSPRGEHGNTHRMVREFLAGAEEAGASTENHFLCQKKIHHCMGCFACWIKTPGHCVIKDDMAGLLEASQSSDVIVYASPIYVGSVTGIMKNFIDRCLPDADPHFQKNQYGVYCHVKRYEKYPDVVLISNCGFPEQSHFKYFRNIFTFLEENAGANIIAEIFRGQGPMLEVEEPSLKPLIDAYNALLRQAGREVVTGRRLSEETRAKLEEPFIPHDLYIEMGNKHWDQVLSKTGA
jgi:multimeric flavodoxin WrbA